MDYHTMSLIELKKAAKEHTPKIKQYYIKTRLELIKILTMTEFSQDMLLAKKTITVLRKEAQERNIPNIWKLRRAELLEVLYPSSKQDNENDDSGKKHNNPEKGDSDQIGVDVLKHTEQDGAEDVLF
jgi:uncharacterized protein YqfB (UPF0267 family)